MPHANPSAIKEYNLAYEQTGCLNPLTPQNTTGHGTALQRGEIKLNPPEQRYSSPNQETTPPTGGRLHNYEVLCLSSLQKEDPKHSKLREACSR